MSNANQVGVRYLAAWNEPDETRSSFIDTDDGAS